MLATLWKAPKVSYSSKVLDVDLSNPDNYGNLTIMGKCLQQLPPFGVVEKDGSPATMAMRIRGYWIVGGTHYALIQGGLFVFSEGSYTSIPTPVGSLAGITTHECGDGTRLLVCGQNYFVSIDGTDFERTAKQFQGVASCQGRAFAFVDKTLYFSALDDVTDFSLEYGHGGTVVVSDSENIVKLVALENKLYVVLDHSIMVLDVSLESTDWQLTTLLSTPYKFTANNVTSSGINLYACVEGKLLVLAGNTIKLVEQLHFGEVNCCAVANGNMYISADDHMIIYDLARGIRAVVDVAVNFMTSTPNQVLFIESEIDNVVCTDSQFTTVRQAEDGWWKKRISFGGDTVRIDSVELLSSQAVSVTLLSDSGESITFSLGGQQTGESDLANIKGKMFDVSLQCSSDNISVKQLKLHYTITKEG